MSILSELGTYIVGKVNNKVDKVAGKQLSTEDYTTTEKSKLGGIEVGATADQTASEILTALKTVDGTGSGLDADLLDGQSGTYYAVASASQPLDATLTALAGVTTAADKLIYATGSDTFTTTTLTAAARTILDDTTVAGMLTTLGISATNTPSTAVGGITATNVQAAIAELDSEKANLNSPSLTGVPASPTAAVGTNTTQLATTAYVVAEINKIEEW